MEFLKFYGVDWLLFVLLVANLWLLGNKCRSAFLFGIVANVCGFTLGIMIGSIATLLMNSTFFIMNCRAYLMWRGVRKPRLAHDTWPDYEFDVEIPSRNGYK